VKELFLLEKGLPENNLTTDFDTFGQLEAYFKV
jgi:hypothetical protein